MNERNNFNLNYCELSSSTLAYRLFGNGAITIVIETALTSCSAEWWPFAEKLSKDYRVLVYDRAGYGKSRRSTLSRIPENIAKELHELLQKLSITKDIILIGHSQGGLYAQQYIRAYRDEIAGAVLIDPLSTEDVRFREELSPMEFRAGGVSKSATNRMGYYSSLIGLSSLLKPMLMKSVPFYYYKDYSSEATDYILYSLTSAKHYKTALEENKLAHDEKSIAHLAKKNKFPDIPLHIIYHNPEVMIKEIMNFGGLGRDAAAKIENIWESIVRSYLSFSRKSKFVKASRSGHFVHLTEFHLIEDAIKDIDNVVKR